MIVAISYIGNNAVLKSLLRVGFRFEKEFHKDIYMDFL
jgi:hypothetical protein